MKFKYKVAVLTDAQLTNLETALNNYGNEGWELVNIIRIAANNNIVVAKKRVS